MTRTTPRAQRIRQNERMNIEDPPLQTEAEYDAAIVEVERLWGALVGTPEGDRLLKLAIRIDVYEAEQRRRGKAEQNEDPAER